MYNEKRTGISQSIVLILVILNTLLLIGIFVLVLVFGTTKSEEVITPTEIVSEGEATNTNEGQKVNKVDYLNSSESVKLQIVAQSFAKAYFSGNLEHVKLYLVDIKLAEVYSKNIYDNLQYMILKWEPEDIATQTRIGIQYQFQEKGTDSADYLGLDMIKISDEWKVDTFYLEK